MMMKKWTLVLLCLSSLALQAQVLDISPLTIDIDAVNPAATGILRAQFLDDRTLAFTGPKTTGVNFIDLSNLQLRKSINPVQGMVDEFLFSPDRRWMIVTSLENEIMLWDMQENELRYTVGEYWPEYLTGKDIYFPPGGTTFGVFQGCYYLCWDLRTGLRSDSVLPFDNECLYKAAYKRDGSKLYGGGNHHIWEHDLQTKKAGKVMPVDDITAVTAIALRPDEKQLAVAGREGLFLIGPDFKGRIDLKGHEDWIDAIMYSADGKYLYSCGGTLHGDDDKVRKWDTKTGACLAVMEGHQNDVESLDISPDGKWIATASWDGTMKIWSAQEGRLLCTIVPLMVDGKLDLFYHTPEGKMFGPDLFYDLVDIRQDDKAVSKDDLIARESRDAVMEVLAGK